MTTQAKNIVIEDEQGNVFFPHTKAEVVTTEAGEKVEDVLEEIKQDVSALQTESQRKDNPHEVTKKQVGLENVENYGIATQAEAEAGVSAVKYMTPLRTKQAIGKTVGNLAALATTNKEDIVQAINEVKESIGDVDLTEIEQAIETVDNKVNEHLAQTIMSEMGLHSQIRFWNGKLELKNGETWQEIAVNGDITSGSNANGHWVRFGDGTQICYATVTFVGNGVGVRNATWTFPASFIGIPEFNGSNKSYGILYDFKGVGGPPNADGSLVLTIEVNQQGASAGSLEISVMAIGRWKEE